MHARTHACTYVSAAREKPVSRYVRFNFTPTSRRNSVYTDSARFLTRETNTRVFGAPRCPCCRCCDRAKSRYRYRVTSAARYRDRASSPGRRVESPGSILDRNCPARERPTLRNVPTSCRSFLRNPDRSTRARNVERLSPKAIAAMTSIGLAALHRERERERERENAIRDF